MTEAVGEKLSGREFTVVLAAWPVRGPEHPAAAGSAGTWTGPAPGLSDRAHP